jgi:hypothetical protein
MQLRINMTHFVKKTVLPTYTAIVVDDDRDVNIVLAAILKLKNLMFTRSIVHRNAWIS